MNTTEPDRHRFGRLLAELRRIKSVSQAVVAEHVGVTPQAVSAWEAGDYAPADRQTVVELDKFLAGGGRLVDALGYTVKPSIESRLTALETELVELAERLERLTGSVERMARRRRRNS